MIGVFTSTNLGFAILLLRIDQPSQSSHNYDARKNILVIRYIYLPLLKIYYTIDFSIITK